MSVKLYEDPTRHPNAKFMSIYKKFVLIQLLPYPSPLSALSSMQEFLRTPNTIIFFLSPGQMIHKILPKRKNVRNLTKVLYYLKILYYVESFPTRREIDT